MNKRMEARDAVFGGLAECYVTLKGTRYNFMHAINVEATMTKNKKEIPILGQTAVGHKASGMKGSGKAKFYYNNSLFRKVMKDYQDTGTDVYFDMVVTNEDETSQVGRQTTILKNCNLDDTIIAKFEAGGDPLEEDCNFTFEKFEMPEEFTNLDGMVE